MYVQTKYARSNDTDIAYQVVGEGEIDLLFVPHFMSNIDIGWEFEDFGRFGRRLESFTRLIRFDRRGNGMSGGVAGTTPLEGQLDDVRAVLDAAGSRQPAVIALHEGAAMALLFAASHPELVRALVLLAPQPRLIRGPGYEWALSVEQRAELNRAVVEHWGSTEPSNPWMALNEDHPSERGLMARYQRLSMSPGEAAAAMRLATETDVREVLGSVQCATLVLRRELDDFIDVRHSRYVAERVPDARYVELPGAGQVWVGDPDGAAREIERFLTGSSPPVMSERLLATVLFTDIVESTERAGQMGDRSWRGLLERHDALVRTQVGLHRGRVVKSLGDGALALFDGPSRAIGCAIAIRDGVRALGLQARAGLHTGECELLAADDVAGIAVHIGARIAALAKGDEILTSSTVRDLTVGSPFRLLEHGEHALKGVPDAWRVFAVDG